MRKLKQLSWEEDDAVALVRVYCGLASAEQAGSQLGSDIWLTVAVVDDAGRLLDLCEVSDDAVGYAELSALLAQRSGGQSVVAVAADSDDHVVTQLLTAAGRYLAFTDDDSADDYAERFADDDSPEEIQSNPAERRAVGLARALQAGVLSAVAQNTPRDLIALKPLLAAHSAVVAGRQGTAATLREVLRELYPAALRAYPDPAEPIPLAVLDALPEPGILGTNSRGRDSQVVAQLAETGVADGPTLNEAITALRVAIAETPRRTGVNRALTAAVAETIRHAVAAVRANDAAVAALVDVLTDRTGRQRAAVPVMPAPTPLRPVRDLEPVAESTSGTIPLAPPRPVEPAAPSVGGRAARMAEQPAAARAVGGRRRAQTDFNPPASPSHAAGNSPVTPPLSPAAALPSRTGPAMPAAGLPSRTGQTAPGTGLPSRTGTTTHGTGLPSRTGPAMPAAALPSRTGQPLPPMPDQPAAPSHIPPSAPPTSPMFPADRPTDLATNLPSDRPSDLLGTPGPMPPAPPMRPTAPPAPYVPAARQSIPVPVQQASPYSTGSQPPVYQAAQHPMPVGPLPTAPPPMAPPPVAPAPVIPPMAPAASVQPISRETMPPMPREPLTHEPFAREPLTPPPPPGMAPLPTRRPTSHAASHAAPVEPAREPREFGFASGAHRMVGDVGSTTGSHDLLAPPVYGNQSSPRLPEGLPAFADPMSSTGGFSALNGLREPEPPQIDMSLPPAPSWSLSASEDALLSSTAERRRVTAIPRLSDGVRESARDAGRDGARDRETARGGVELPRQREGRVTPPWQADDLPAEPPGLRLVEPAPLPDPALSADRPYSDELSGEFRFEPPALRLVEPSRGNGGSRGRRAAEHSIEDTPLPADNGGGGDDGDLLIFAAARSAWFTDYDTEQVGESAELNWGANDVGWRAAERAARPTVTEETTSGLPRRVPQQNLVPGSPISPPDERPLRIVRDAASIAAHTTGYFRGWRRGQEVGGYSVGGRPGRESAGGWDFTRDTGARDYEDREFEYRSARR